MTNLREKHEFNMTKWQMQIFNGVYFSQNLHTCILLIFWLSKHPLILRLSFLLKNTSI